jgi:hypothetical protein
MRKRSGWLVHGMALVVVLSSAAVVVADPPGYPGWATGYPQYGYPPALMPVAAYPPPSFADLQPGMPIDSLASQPTTEESLPTETMPAEVIDSEGGMARSVTAAEEASAFSDQPAPEYHPNFAPQMIGAFRGMQGVTIVPVNNAGGGVTFARLEQPLVGRGAFKIAENESPIPRDRVFITYNYYSNLPTAGRDGLFLPGDGTQVDLAGPLIRSAAVDVHQQVFGFEKTLGDGRLSIGLRVPIFQSAGGDIDPLIPGGSSFSTGLGDGSGSDIGDLTAVLKWAMFGDMRSGSVVTSGLAVTAPTGPHFFAVNPHLPINSLLQPTSVPDLVLTRGDRIDSTLIQPYLGVLLNGCKFYFHGFTSLVVPTDAPDVTMLFNDYGVGCYLYQAADDKLINFITPTLELHVNTPLSNRGGGAEVFMPDIVNFTNGVHIGVAGCCLFTAGLAMPVTGPRPYDVGAIFQFNFVF